MVKKLFIIIFLSLNSIFLFADEGMWLPSQIAERIADMQSKGFKLTAEDIYSINSSSLKDAIVHFNGGCTGELISNEGLLITNHHCGYGQIQAHSSVEHDYLKDGFWAMNRSEELPNENLYVASTTPGKALVSKRVNTEVYSANMTKAGSTVSILDNFIAIENFVVGKTVAELEAEVAGKDAAAMIDTVAGCTLADTLGYVNGILEAAKAVK